MPIYTYRCLPCTEQGHGVRLYERFLPVKQYKEPTPCPVCQENMIRVITPPTLFVKNDEVIKAIAEANANNEVIREPGMAQEAKKNKEYHEANRRKEIHKLVADTVSQFDF